jgi:hypothetical protein
MTVLGIAEDGQKNGTPIGGAPAPKPTFLKMIIQRAGGIITGFCRVNNDANWLRARINK